MTVQRGRSKKKNTKAFHHKRLYYLCGSLIFLTWWCVSSYVQQIDAQEWMTLLPLLLADNATTTHKQQQQQQQGEGPSVRIIRASELKNRTKRVIANQEALLSLDNCPRYNHHHENLMMKNQTQATTTLVTQLSVERFWLVQEICQHRWKIDPMAVTIYFASLQEYRRYGNLFLQNLTRAKCRHVHLIYYIDDDSTTIQQQRLEPRRQTTISVYPINLLRNLALETVQTSHVLVHDVDFIPSVNLADDIRWAWSIRNAAHVATWSSSSSSRMHNHQALVVPALQTNDLTPKASLEDSQQNQQQRPSIPRTFDEAVYCLQQQQQQQSHYHQCTAFDENQKQAHGATRTDLWAARKWYHAVSCHKDRTRVKDLRYVPCIDSPAYEPYLVLPWCSFGGGSSSSSSSSSDQRQRSVPYYDERFVGYGWNKIQLIHHLRYLGFLLWVLPAGFLVHVPHEPSAAQRAFTTDRKPARQVYLEFEKELHSKYEWKQSNLRTCQHWNKYFGNMTYSQAFCKSYA